MTPVPRTLACVFLLAASARLLVAQNAHPLLDTEPLPPSAHLELQLQAGGYTIRSSTDGRLHVSEISSEGHPEQLHSTDIHFRQTGKGARLEVETPSGGHGPQVAIALPSCAALDVHLTAGELVFETVPCTETESKLYTGELRAMLGDPAAYRAIHASVTIGEVSAPGLGTSNGDEEHGGFFRSFHRKGSGSKSFSAHVGTGQITLDRSHQ